MQTGLNWIRTDPDPVGVDLGNHGCELSHSVTGNFLIQRDVTVDSVAITTTIIIRKIHYN